MAFLVTERVASLDFTSVLHVAPEPEVERWLRSKAKEYLSIDLAARAMVRMDLTDLKLDDSSRTLIWAAHVMEHIPDDAAAISEMYRVLRPGGTALIQVPIWRTNTFEDPTVRDPEQRLALFYQRDHVRLYGLDIQERFDRLGFSSAVHRAQDFGPDILLKYGLSFPSTDEVFIFTKPQSVHEDAGASTRGRPA